MSTSAPGGVIAGRAWMVVAALACFGCGNGLLVGDGDDDAVDASPAGADAGSPGDGAVDTLPDAAPPDAALEPVDCSGIAADPDYELCQSTSDSCAGVFTDGAGCAAFCAAAGLVCTATYGGEPGCSKEAGYPLDCNAASGHTSDWCECGRSDYDPGGCATEPGNPPLLRVLDQSQATYTERHNWVLTCSLHAYTASSAEHQSCDSGYFPDGSRTGTATFTFADVAPGRYDVHIESRHTLNRNPEGALFYADGHAAIIWQRDEADYVWDLHGTYCLAGPVEVILDSTVNGGSDAVKAVRLTPAQ